MESQAVTLIAPAVAVGADFAIVLDAASLSPTARLIGDVDWVRFALDFAEYVARMDADEGRR